MRVPRAWTLSASSSKVCSSACRRRLPRRGWKWRSMLRRRCSVGPRPKRRDGGNGAGKSSIGGAAFRASGADYYNPDETARELTAAQPGLTLAEANAAAWRIGRALLEPAIQERLNFAFETTLGGNTIPRLLGEAAKSGVEVL